MSGDRIEPPIDSRTRARDDEDHGEGGVGPTLPRGPQRESRDDGVIHEAETPGAFGHDDEGRWVRHVALNGVYVSGVLADDGGGWCWYCGTHHAEATTKRTPCCGDCWFDEAPEK